MIKLSKHGDYALKAVLFIAKHEGLLKIADIAVALDISDTFLRKVIAKLEAGNIIETVQGRYGGVKISRDFSEISVYDILLSVGEELSITDCTAGKFCDKQGGCDTTHVLSNMQKSFHGILKLYSLEKILGKY